MSKGAHGTLLDLLPGMSNLERAANMALGRTVIGGDEIRLTHVLMAVMVFFVVVGLVLWAGFRRIRADDRLLPDGRFSPRAFFEVLVEALLGLMREIIGPEQAERYLPLVGTLALFILFSNLLGLVPGLAPATSSLNTTVACALPVFFATHYFGFRAHGLKYLKHFAGPVPILAPLMVPIELVSHIARPLSLSLRLFGNIMGDHKVLAIFVGLFPLLVPIPVLVLGVAVALVQTMVFCLLSMVYISMAVKQEEE